MWQIEGNSMIVSGYSNSSVCATNLRLIHTRDFAPGACSRGTLQEQSSSVCTNDFMGILHPREQNFHPAKCSTIFNQLNIWEQGSRGKFSELENAPRVYWHVQNEPGACPRSKTPLVYRPLQTEAKMENVICLHLVADSLDKSLLFKECIVLIFNWESRDTCLYNH